MSERVSRTLAELDVPPRTEGVLRWAFALWRNDPASGLTDMQIAWLRTRARDATRRG